MGFFSEVHRVGQNGARHFAMAYLFLYFQHTGVACREYQSLVMNYRLMCQEQAALDRFVFKRLYLLEFLPYDDARERPDRPLAAILCLDVSRPSFLQSTADPVKN